MKAYLGFILVALSLLSACVSYCCWLWWLCCRWRGASYDAAYLGLAEKTGEALVTGDERLFNAVHGQPPSERGFPWGWVVYGG